MNTGSIIDFYDDPNGFVLQQKLGSAPLPEFIKTAQFLTDDQRDRLPDDVFALVMVDRGEGIKKFACTDPGNTALSVLYFMENKDKLPEPAQKVAAANLVRACEWYDLDIPGQLQKIAGIGTALNAGFGAMQVKGAVDQGVQRHNQMMGKVGDLSGTRIMPKQSDNPEDEEKIGHVKEARKKMKTDGEDRGLLTGFQKLRQQGKESKAVRALTHGTAGATAGAILGAVVKGKGGKGFLNKARAAVGGAGKGAVVGGAAGAPVGVVRAMLAKGKRQAWSELSAGEKKHAVPVKKKTAEALQPYVDVTGLEPMPKIAMVASERTLLGGHFPVDTYGEVEQARDWFESNGAALHPADRREYCIKLASRAAELNIELTSTIHKYAGSGYASPDDLEIAVETRRQYWTEDSPERDLLKGLMEKRASVSPDLFCQALCELDQATGLDMYWDSGVMDPYLSTYGIDKAAGTGWYFEHGGDRVDEELLQRLALKDGKELCKKFGKEMAEEFRKKPREIFSSLPLDHKRIIMRMANDPQP
jgi:hypothetical protein